MMIPVVLKDGTSRQVFPQVLDGLLDSGKVMVFKRSSGWVLVGKDPIRSCGGSSGKYEGAERRASHRQELS